MPPIPEFAAKQERVARWLAERRADAILFCSPPNVAWLGCGGELLRCDAGLGFVVGGERCWLLCPAEDADRLRQEEVRGFGLEIVPLAWLGLESLVERARSLLEEKTRWKCDVPGLGLEHDASCDLLRRTLGAEEIERLRKLGKDAAAAVEEVASECFRGILERDAAARLAAECVRRQIVPLEVLAGADDRLLAYARPLPKAGSAEKLLVLGVIGMRAGLHVALSRTICLVRPDGAFTAAFQRTLETATRLCHAARVGEPLGTAVQRALPQPALHLGSLGGLAGYALPEVEARPSATWPLAAGQSLVWRVASPGARCEDTFLLAAEGSERVTATEGWPRRAVQVGDRSYEVPDLLLL